MHRLIQGDCLQVMATLEDNSVDAVITDPPYELGLMGKSWDSTGIAYNVDVWRQALRVLKPGGHLMAFGGTRTYHRMACAIQDAGFEIRDMIEWVYGSGFPKSLNIGKAVDKLQGNEREVVWEWKPTGMARPSKGGSHSCAKTTADCGYDPDINVMINITKGTSPYEGWGTALKPAHEPICLARKPLSERNVAENVLKWGTGGINVDACRVESETIIRHATQNGKLTKAHMEMSPWMRRRIENGQPLKLEFVNTLGRFPANLIHDGSAEVQACFPESKTGSTGPFEIKSSRNVDFRRGLTHRTGTFSGDSGNASRYFKSIIYTAKASKADRGKDNIHATVKPTALMEYLITMIAPTTAVILDPFMGSGTTGVAACRLGRDFIGIELDPDYMKIAQARIQAAQLPLFEQDQI